jgi:DNA-binding NtrC family response regulator
MEAVVLVVEDDERTRKAYKRQHSERFRIVPAASLQEARHLLRTRHVDYVVADVLLPDGSGLDLLKEVAKNYPHIRRAALSGALDSVRATVAGRVADVVAWKPITLKQVVIALESPTAEAPLILGAPESPDGSLPMKLQQVVDQTITRALSRNGGNVSKAAEELDVGRPTLYRALSRLGLHDPD